MTAFKALLHTEEDINRFLDNPPQLEDEIKQLLKVTSSGNNKVVKKLQLAQSTLTEITIESTHIPISLTSAISQNYYQ